MCRHDFNNPYIIAHFKEFLLVMSVLSCCCDRKALVWEFSFFLLPSKTEWALVYCLEGMCLHSATSCTQYINEMDLQTREIPYGNQLLGQPGEIKKNININIKCPIFYLIQLLGSIVQSIVQEGKLLAPREGPGCFCKVFCPFIIIKNYK